MQKTTFFNLNETISPAGVVKSNPLLDFLHENNLSSCIQFKNNEKFFESQIPIEKISYEGKYLFSPVVIDIELTGFQLLIGILFVNSNKYVSIYFDDQMNEFNLFHKFLYLH